LAFILLATFVLLRSRMYGNGNCIWIFTQNSNGRLNEEGYGVWKQGVKTQGFLIRGDGFTLMVWKGETKGTGEVGWFSFFFCVTI
jgi:hypothetical protein